MATAQCLVGHTAASSCPVFGYRRGRSTSAVRRAPAYVANTRVSATAVVSELSLEERKKEARAWISPWLNKKSGGGRAAATAPMPPPVAATPPTPPPAAAKPAVVAKNGNGASNGKVEGEYLVFTEAMLKDVKLPS